MLQCFHDPERYLAELARLLLLFSPDAWLDKHRCAQALERGNEDMAHYQLHRVQTTVETLSLYYVFYAPMLRPLLRFMNRYCGHVQCLEPLATSTVICSPESDSMEAHAPHGVVFRLLLGALTLRQVEAYLHCASGPSLDGDGNARSMVIEGQGLAFSIAASVVSR